MLYWFHTGRSEEANGVLPREADIVYEAFYLVCKEKVRDAKPPRDSETTRSTFSEEG
jgi:hypothetical protein